MKEILVSIICDVFNHEPYLRQCLDGFVMQITDFEFEVLIHDDASTDNSVGIIQEYIDKYPNINWKPIFQQKNQFSQGVGIWCDIQFPRANGKYIAICEGDDYWTDPLKLQKQVEILESNSLLMGIVTNSSQVDDKGNVLLSRYDSIVPKNTPGQYTLRQFFSYSFTYPTGTIVFRNNHRQEVIDKFRITKNPYLGDWTLWIILHTFGDFYYIDDVTAAYRINPTSVTHSKVDERRLGLAKANFKIIKNVASILPEEYADIRDNLLHEKGWLWFNLANAYKHVHKYFLMAGCLLICGILDPKLLYQKLTNRNK